MQLYKAALSTFLVSFKLKYFSLKIFAQEFVDRHFSALYVKLFYSLDYDT